MEKGLRFFVSLCIVLSLSGCADIERRLEDFGRYIHPSWAYGLVSPTGGILWGNTPYGDVPKGSPLSKADLFKQQDPHPAVFRMYKNGAASAGGFVVSSDGKAVTALHIVKHDAGPFVAVFADGRIRELRVVGIDEKHDLAALQIVSKPGETFQFFKVSKKDPRVGEEVVAIGHPLGIEYVRTEGVITKIGAMVVSNAPTYPGNSGGPLYDKKTKEVVEIVYGVPPGESIDSPDTYGASGPTIVQFLVATFPDHKP